MRKLFFIMTSALAAVLAFAACQKEEQILPEVSFKTISPTIVDETAEFTLVVNNYTDNQAVEIPVQFGGDAVKGEDYSVSAEKFVVGGAGQVLTIKVTPLKFGTGKKVTLTLLPPTGFKAGKYTLSEFALADKIGFLSFDLKKNVMTDAATVVIGVYDGNGLPLKLEKDCTFEIGVDQEKTTAVENENFKFAEGKNVVIKAGSSKGSLKLQIAGDPVENKDVIVLTLDPGAKFDLGQNATSEITILGPDLGKVAGSWVASKLVTDKDSFKATWTGSVAETSYNGLPEFNAEDGLAIDLDNSSFKPSFKSSFKDYFIGESKISFKGKMVLRVDYSTKAELNILELDNTNRFFSPSEKSEDKVSLIGVRVIKLDDEDVLDLYLFDYTSKAFMPEFLEFMYGETKPVATSTGVFFNYTFKRAAK